LSDEADELADEVSQQAASSTAATVRSVLPETHAAPPGRPAWQMGAAGLVGLAIVGGIVIMAKKLLNAQLPKVQAVRRRRHRRSPSAALARKPCKIKHMTGGDVYRLVGDALSRAGPADTMPGSHFCVLSTKGHVLATLQAMQTKQLQRESQSRLNGFIDDLRNNVAADLSAKNLGEEGTQYIAEGLAFNDKCVPVLQLALLPAATLFLPQYHVAEHGSACNADACLCKADDRLCRCKLADFRNNGIGLLGMTALVEAFKSNDVLESLLLGTNSIGDEGAELLARHMAGTSLCAICQAPPTPLLATCKHESSSARAVDGRPALSIG